MEECQTVRWLRKFAEIKGMEDKFAIERIDSDGRPYLELFNGKKSYDIIYDGKYLKGENTIYRVYECTCGGLDSDCAIGKPAQKCIDNKIYSPRKCAVYSFDVINFFTTRFTLTIEEFYKLKDVL
jgi:hypothetical protein